MSKLTDNIEDKIENDIKELGYEIEYIEYVKEGDAKILRVVIDKKETSLTTDDCEIVSKKIEDKIDGLISGDDSYILEVSSPGPERALKNTKLYIKYLGYNVKLKLYKKVEGTKELEGVLCDADESTVTLLVQDKKIQIERENIACGNTVYEF